MCVPKKTLFHEFGWLKHSKIKSHVNNFSGVGIFKNEKDSRTTDTAKWSSFFLKLSVAKMSKITVNFLLCMVFWISRYSSWRSIN